jgi:hypothetical protein
MLACQGSQREKYNRCLSLNIGSPDYKTQGLRLCRDVSLIFKRSVGIDEIVLADWLTYYIQTSLFVKVFVRPFCNLLATFLSDNFLDCHPVFWGESELYVFARFCQGIFRNSFGAFCWPQPFCISDFRDSETQLYAY